MENVSRPKAFTKEWYGYVWDYYKVHILIGVLVVVLAYITIVDIANTVRYDANINFVAQSVISDDLAEIISSECEKNSDDLNKNGRVDVSFSQINFTEENVKNTEVHQGLLNKLMTLYNSTDELIFLVDDKLLKDIESMKYTDDIFYKTSVWADDDAKRIGEYAVSLEDSNLLSSLGVDSKKLYVLVAKKDIEDGFKPEEENAIKIARFLSK